MIDGLVFIEPRRILFELNGVEPDELEVMERPLRGQTARGERIALARSEVVPVGSRVEFEILVLGVIEEAAIREWMDYGTLKGMGQWRNASWGRFSYTMHCLSG